MSLSSKQRSLERVGLVSEEFGVKIIKKIHMADRGGGTKTQSAGGGPAGGGGAGGGARPVPMKLFATWEVDRTPSNCIPRLVS